MAASKSGRNRRPGGGAAARALLVLFFCAGIAFLGLLGGGDYPEATARRGADPMAGYYGSDMPRYPGVQELPAGPNSSVGGSKVRMSFFTTEDEPGKVGRYYAEAWRARRLFVRSDVTHMGGVVSAVDAVGGKVYQVLLTAREQGTVAYPSLTTAPLQALARAPGEPAAPLYPGSKAVLDIGSQEGVAGARVSMSVNDGTLEENLAHYQRELEARGFKREVGKQPEKLGQGHRILLYRLEDREVTVNLHAISDKRTRVHLAEVAAP